MGKRQAFFTVFPLFPVSPASDHPAGAPYSAPFPPAGPSPPAAGPPGRPPGCKGRRTPARRRTCPPRRRSCPPPEWQIQNRTADEAQNADDQRIQQLAPDEAGENVVHLVGPPEDPVDLLLGKQAVGDLPGVSDAALLGGHEVDGDNGAHQQVFQEVHRADYAAGNGHHQHLGPGQDLVFQPAGGSRIEGVHLVGYPGLHSGVALQQVLHPAADGIIIALYAGKQLHHALIQLGQQHMAQQIAQQADDGPGQHQADGPGPPGDQPPQFPGRFQPSGKEAALNKVDDRSQQIGQHAADQHRL